MKKILSLFLAIFMIFSLAACSSVHSSPESSAKSFMEKMYAGDVDGVMKMIHIPDDEKNSAGLEDMIRGKLKASIAKNKKMVEENGGIKDIKVEKVDYSNDNKKAAVKVITTFNKDNKPRIENIGLIKTDDGWKVKF